MEEYENKEELAEYNNILKISAIRIKNTSLDIVREAIDTIDWDERLIAIMGARGCGKTTLILQNLKRNPELLKSAVYISLDNISFTKVSLFAFVERFVKYGGTIVYVDEIHKYPTWSAEVKMLYDTFPNLKLVITGSSILDIYKGFADLSRRAVRYIINGLSFREFLRFDRGIVFPLLALETVLKEHVSIAMDITSKILVLPAFVEYLSHGYYPFFMESKRNYEHKLLNIINIMIETDLPAVHNMEFASTYKLKKMLMMLAELGPYKPDITKLAAQLEINRNYTLTYLHYLRDAQLLSLLKTDEGRGSILAKPEKVYLSNTNLAKTIGGSKNDKGAMREIFFFNQLDHLHKVTYTEMGDFLIDDTYTFEVGGKNKKFAQIKDLPHSFVALDETEIGFNNKIPIWLFGFLY